MSGIVKFFDFYIKSSIHVGLSVCALSWITTVILKLNVSLFLFIFLFFATVSGYNLIKYGELFFSKPKSFSVYFKSLLGFSFFSAFITFFMMFYLPSNVIKLLIVLGLLSFFYAFPFYKQKNLRAITGLKLILVALVWAGVTVLIPIVNANIPLNKTIIFLFLQRFLFVFVLTLPFEIRDLKNDALILGTLPQRVGVKNTKIIGVLLVIPITLLQFWISKDIIQISSLFVILLLLSVFLVFTKKNQSMYYTAFWVESIPIFWAILIFLLMKIFFSNNFF